jgi:hypothetical protein
MHFGTGARAAGRVNLMACVNGAMIAKKASRESIIIRGMIGAQNYSNVENTSFTE